MKFDDPILENIELDILKRKYIREYNARKEAEFLLETKTKELYLLNQDLENRVENELEKNKKNEEFLFHQAKLASMGEMLGNIAHQWRQPLSAITMSSSAISLEYEYNNLTKQKLDYYTEKIMENSQYLSQTIDTFRDFLKNDSLKVKRNVLIEIDEAIKIFSDSLKDSNIEFRNQIIKKELYINSSANQLSQVLINIVNNAKEAILENNGNAKWIEFSLLSTKNKLLLTIEDSGGGIPEDIKYKIFEPYFTTKHKYNGTGLGLHMCYRIITEKLEGNISVENTKSGAKFFIELPLFTNSH